MSNLTWRDKAHRLIADACRASYLQANTSPSGKRYKKHRDYAVPQAAEDLIRCLDTDDEHGAKALFWNYIYTPELLGVRE